MEHTRMETMALQEEWFGMVVECGHCRHRFELGPRSDTMLITPGTNGGKRSLGVQCPACGYRGVVRFVARWKYVAVTDAAVPVAV